MEPIQFDSQDGARRIAIEMYQTTASVKLLVRAACALVFPNVGAAALFDELSTTWSKVATSIRKVILDHDKVSKASLLIDLFKWVGLLFNNPLTQSWHRTVNAEPIFNWKLRPRVLCVGGVSAMIEVRQSIDACRGGM